MSQKDSRPKWTGTEYSRNYNYAPIGMSLCATTIPKEAIFWSTHNIKTYIVNKYDILKRKLFVQDVLELGTIKEFNKTHLIQVFFIKEALYNELKKNNR